MSIYDPLSVALGIAPMANPSYLQDISIEDHEPLEIYQSVWAGNKHSEDSKTAIGNSNRGKKRTDEAKQKMRLAKLGKKCPRSDEHNRRIADSINKWYETHSNPRKGKGKKYGEVPI